MAKSRVKAGTNKSAAADRQAAFAKAYIANGHNGTQAAITAGYSAKTAAAAASRLLRDVNTTSLIAELAAPAIAKASLSVDRTLQELARIAYFDPRLAFNGANLKSPEDWDDETAAAVASVETLEEYSGTGEDRELIGHTKKLKLWDKPRALDMAMKHLGLYERDNAQLSKPVSIKMVFE